MKGGGLMMLLGKGKAPAEESAPDVGGDEDIEGGAEAAFAEFSDAVKAGDPKGGVAALKQLIKLCHEE